MEIATKVGEAATALEVARDQRPAIILMDLVHYYVHMRIATIGEPRIGCPSGHVLIDVA